MQTQSDRAFEAIEAAIVSGDIPLGSKIREEEFAARLGVSRGPLREAVEFGWRDAFSSCALRARVRASSRCSAMTWLRSTRCARCWKGWRRGAPPST